MMLQFFIPPIVLAFPVFGKVQEKKDKASLRRDSAGSEDDISLPSLGDLSISSGESFISEHTCDELSQVELCHLIGPEVSKDELNHSLPADLVKPQNLENSMTMSLPVGYYRLRRAFLADDDDFWNSRVLDRTLQYKK